MENLYLITRNKTPSDKEEDASTRHFSHEALHTTESLLTELSNDIHVYSSHTSIFICVHEYV